VSHYSGFLQIEHFEVQTFQNNSNYTKASHFSVNLYWIFEVNPLSASAPIKEI